MNDDQHHKADVMHSQGDESPNPMSSASMDLRLLQRDVERIDRDVKAQIEPLNKGLEVIRQRSHDTNNSLQALYSKLELIQLSIDNSIKTQAKEAERLAVSIERMEMSLNGDDSHLGLKGRLDRLEQQIGGWVWVLRAVTLAVIGLIGQLLWRAFSGQK